MEKTPINFKQKRDFGEIFNATFTFIGQEFKPLGKVILMYVLPVLLVAAILNVLVSIEYQKFFNTFKTDNIEMISSPFAAMAGIYKYLFLYLLVYLLAFTALRCSIYSYIKVYVEKGKDQVTMADVWTEIRRFFFPVLGTSILIGLLVGVGYILCILPGIWLGVSLCMIFISLVYEGKGLGKSFDRSFNLIKNNWWVTFAVILVSYILVYILAMVLSIPTMLMGFKSLFSSLKNGGNPGLMNYSTTYYILNSIITLLTYIMFSVPFIAISFQYFSLVEIKERPSLEQKIEQIG